MSYPDYAWILGQGRWTNGPLNNAAGTLTKLEPRSNVKVMFATVGSGVKKK